MLTNIAPKEKKRKCGVKEVGAIDLLLYPMFRVLKNIKKELRKNLAT